MSEREMEYMVRDEKRFDYGYIQHANEEKSKCITANISKGVPYNVCIEPINVGFTYCTEANVKNLMRDFGSKGKIVSGDDKTHTLTTQSGGGNGVYYAEPYIPTIKVGGVHPVNQTDTGKSQTLKAQYVKNSVMNFVGYTSTYGATGAAEKIEGVIELDPEFMVANGIYKVIDGKIIVKGKEYPIKLNDGYYRIRKLTVKECMRLQQVPEWYEFPVSNSQAYKMLGNGWSCEVIKHLILSMLSDQGKKKEKHIVLDDNQLEGQMNIFDYL